MGQRKVVTTVCIDPQVFEVGREDGFNFSQLLERAIIDEQDPERKILSLKAKIKYHEDEAVKLRDEVEIVKKLDNKLRKLQQRNIIEKYLPAYREMGILVDEVEMKLCSQLKMDKIELMEFFDECIESDETG